MKEKIINGLISRFEEKCAFFGSSKSSVCVFMTVAEMRLTIRSLRKHVNTKVRKDG